MCTTPGPARQPRIDPQLTSALLEKSCGPTMMCCSSVVRSASPSYLSKGYWPTASIQALRGWAGDDDCGRARVEQLVFIATNQHCHGTKYPRDLTCCGAQR